MIRHPLTVASGLAAIAVALVLILRGPVGSVEDQVTSWKYQLRGSRQADTNVVIVYIDDEAVKSLGWPVRRIVERFLAHELRWTDQYWLYRFQHHSPIRRKI